MLRNIPSALSMSALGVFAGFAALHAARAEPAELLSPAINEDAGFAVSRMDKTLAAVPLGIAFARGARGDAHGGRFAGGSRMDGGFSGGHMGSGFPGRLVGGSFAWPYYDYCSRHPANRNC